MKRFIKSLKWLKPIIFDIVTDRILNWLLVHRPHYYDEIKALFEEIKRSEEI